MISVGWHHVVKEFWMPNEQRIFWCFLCRSYQNSGFCPARISHPARNDLILERFVGIYPHVTSSACGIGGVLSGLGLAPKYIDNIYGVVRAYMYRYGTGFFPTQLNNVRIWRYLKWSIFVSWNRRLENIYLLAAMSKRIRTGSTDDVVGSILWW